MKKVCYICKTEKDNASFNRDRNSKDGLCSRCSDCNRAQMRAYHQAHPEERKAYGRIYNQTHKAEIRAYQQANQEKIQAYRKEYKARNREYLAQMERLRKQKIRAKAARYAAKIDPQQLKPEDVNNNVQSRLFNA